MDYLINLSILFSIYGILAVSLNLLVGYTGLVSLAHAAFYGIGAYAAALLMTKAQMGFFRRCCAAWDCRLAPRWSSAWCSVNSGAITT